MDNLPHLQVFFILIYSEKMHHSTHVESKKVFPRTNGKPAFHNPVELLIEFTYCKITGLYLTHTVYAVNNTNIILTLNYNLRFKINEKKIYKTCTSPLYYVIMHTLYLYLCL